MQFDKTRWSCPRYSDQNCTQNSAVGVRGGEWGGKGGRSDIRNKVKSLKIDIAERTRNSESSLLKILYL